MAITTDKIKKFIELRSEGESFDKLVKKLKVSKPTLIRLDKKYRKEVSEAATIKESAFLEGLQIQNRVKVEELLLFREKVYKEVNKIELSQLNSKELFQLLKSTEDLISRHTNIEQHNKDIYELRRELSEMEQKLTVQNIFLNHHSEQNRTDDEKMVFSEEELKEINKKSVSNIKLRRKNHEKISN